ncbi:beta-class carbonic anhydrase [Lederbergia galactosidilytica]|uniref:carbonic anhydrase n=1 Tax=Lederbergia galactosidilytica TaxID=217031 RepID=A0A177ZQK9_9BACI|nr:carbonic anhydrase [Virgibacillus soli]OAK70125.1 carbonic anhydrase [Lederbergia galactosidilytica]
MKKLTLLSEVLQYNQKFTEEKLYESFSTTKFPDKKMVIFTCMDTRLIELLHKAMNLKNGDAKVVKNAGAILTHPFGSIMRSLLVAVYQLQADEVCVIGHHDCGMSALNSQQMIEDMKERGITQETLDTVIHSGIDLDQWLQGFDSVEESVTHSVEMIRNHPLMVKDVPIHGLVIDPETGKLDLVIDGYEHTK